MDHCLRDEEPSLHASRQGPRIGVRLVGKVHRGEEFIAFPLRTRHSIEPGLDLERFARREEWIEDDLLRDDSDRTLRVTRVLVDVETPDVHLAAGLHDEPGKDVDEGRLARAIGAEKAENLAARDVEADVVQRTLPALIGL
jgi:hypothetical protein